MIRLIITGAIAVVAGLGGAGLTALINRKNTKDTLGAARLAADDQWRRTLERDHLVWLRDQKQEVYAEFLACAQAVVQQLLLVGPKDEKPRTLTELGVWLSRITLVGSDNAVTVSNSIGVRAAKAVHLHEKLLDAKSGFSGASGEEIATLQLEFNDMVREFQMIVDGYAEVVRGELGTQNKQSFQSERVPADTSPPEEST